MNTNDEIIFPIDTLEKSFDSFLETENNSRIFFSGKFGLGKTYFINKFFENKIDSYEVFHIYPVNYQISSNENILDLINYDILIELIKKNPNLFEESKLGSPYDLALLFYSWANSTYTPISVLKSFLGSTESLSSISLDPMLIAFGKLGKHMGDVLSLVQDFDEYRKKVEAGEKGDILEYLNKIRDELFKESDYISYLLKKYINKQKESKKSILVLDDLDRLDPEHTFRILNLLSSYFEREHENKFGFDKIIIVADYDNLKSIFHHKYGENTDFSGYIDKFFTIEPFYMDNSFAITRRVSEIVSNIKTDHYYLSDALYSYSYLKCFLRLLFTRFIESGEMSLRELLKVTKTLPKLKGSNSFENNHSKESKFFIDIGIEIAVSVFSNKSTLLSKIKSSRRASSVIAPSEDFSFYMKEILELLGETQPRDGGESSLSWKTKSSFVIIPDGANGIKEKFGKQEELFFEILIEYMNRDIHKKGYLRR